MFVIDPFSGVSGDMFISAFLDFVDKDELIETVKKVIDVDIEIKKVNKKGILANKIDINLRENFSLSTYQEFKELIKNSNLNNKIKEDSLKILHLLAEAEAKVHGVEIEKVHFHEIADYDTIVDVVGASYIINKLNLKNNCFYRPINVGGGFVKTSHGLYPIPAPATAELLKGFKIFYSNYGELTTPTGGAILKYINPRLIESFEYSSISYGAGEKELEIPNVLRVFKLLNEEENIYIVETNVDDISPEVLGYLHEVLRERVRDLHFIPIYMKKNRPAYLIRAIVKDNPKEVAKIIMRETGTLGVRILKYKRVVAERDVKRVKVYGEEVRVKIGKIDNEVIMKKPEYEDLKRLALKLKKPLKDLYLEVIGKLE
ncbi:nickel pincer cofactor biosynthesis protein LarC [Methanocaldococcus infernus]